MKTKKTKALGILAAIAAMVFAAGCDDGTLGTQAELSIAPPAPMIISFYADPSEIAQGESTTIYWEVAGADEVQITAVAADGTPVSFGISTDQLSGSETVANLASTTDFTLTANKSAEVYEAEDESEGDDVEAQKVSSGQIQFGPEIEEEPEVEPEPSEVLPAISEVSQTITVTVAPAGTITASITADSSSVMPGESTVIRWIVSPSDNIKEVGVVADTGEAIIPTDQCDGSMDDILAQPALDEFPAVGCAVVTPETLTNYTVNAESNSGDHASDSVRVDVGVEPADVEAKIFAGLTADQKVEDVFEISSYQNPVVVSWEVEPAAAKVTIVASPSVTATTEAPCELPQDALDATQGNTKCKISEQTEFIITATYGEESDTDKVVVFKKAAGSAGLVVSQKWAFEGEKVTVNIGLDAATMADPSAIESVTVDGISIDVEQLKQDKHYEKEVTVGEDNVSVVLKDTAGHTYTYVAVKAIEMEFQKLDSDEVAVSSLALKRLGSDYVRYTGVELSSFNDGVARIKEDGGSIDVPFHFFLENALGMSDLWSDLFFENFARYPVAVEIGKDADDIFAGVPGIILRSTDHGASWDWIRISRRRAADKKNWTYDPEGHDSCGYDVERQGPKKLKDKQMDYDGDFVSLNGVCDIIYKDGRVIVGTDYGARVEPNVNNDEWAWYGKPPEGHTGSEYGYLTYSKVVHDVELAGNKVYAATSSGLYVSPAAGDGADLLGITWDEVSGMTSGSIYSLAYDEATETLYVGTGSGMRSKKLSGGGNFSGIYTSGAVMSIAIDPTDPKTVVIGTATGAKVTRNGGDDWSTIYSGGPVEKVALKARKVSGKTDYAIAMGSPNGELFRKFNVQETAGGGNIIGVLVIDQDDDQPEEQQPEAEDEDDVDVEDEEGEDEEPQS